PLAEGPAPSRGALPVERGRLAPGEAVSALLAWGDVEVSATGTVTATSKDGRFLAFGHPLLKRGDVAYPAARAIIHETVRSRSFPFKLASPTAIIGTVAQDREVGIGGRVGTFAPSISAALVFKDRDTGRREERAFRVVPDAFLSARLLEAVYGGLVEDAWGRRGQGTMSVTLRIEGKGVTNGWTRRDVSFSDDDVAAVALKQPCLIMDAFLTQPFEDVMPLGFRLDVEATEEPRALFIEDVEAPSKARPGEDVPVKVVLRPWRGKTVTREVVLKVPESASGVCELLVRGGGAQPMPQLAIEGGWRSIESLGSMLKEIAALDANDELIVELHADAVSDALKRAAPQKGRSSLASSDLLPEETELLSETKERRIKEGTLRILRADRYVDGMMKRIIQVDTDDIDTDAGPKKEPTKDAPKKGPKKASKASRPDAARP
ncbi:MAG: hypothetical protein IJR14_00290, partial [Synergistaceae bacterium]|nr:hypothetical protein [Synergistaceae bacterium]